MILRKLLFILFLAPVLLAQNPKEVALIAAKYPDERAIFLKYDVQIDIRLEAEMPVLKVKNREEVLLLREDSKNLASDKIYYNSFMKVEDVQLGTLVPEKNKYRFVPVTDKKVQRPLSNYVFYDDSKEITYNFPEPAKNNILSTSYTTTYLEPWMSKTLLFQQYYPTANLHFKMNVAKGIELGYNMFGTLPKGIDYSEYVEPDGSRSYEWKGNAIDKYVYEEKMPPLLYVIPHIVLYVKGFVQKDEQWKPVTGDVQSLYDKYYDLSIDKWNEPDDTMRALAQQIIGKRLSEYDKAKAIYNWVQDNIKYIAFEHGMEGFIPRPAALVCNNKYGDCKDMSVVIVNLARAAGLKAWPVWIGTRDIPYRYDESATAASDNHMVACVEIDGKKRILDGTGEYQPFGLVTSFIQGKEGLIGLDKNKFEILRIPQVPAAENLISDSVSISYDVVANRLSGSGRWEAGGYRKIDLMYQLKGEDEKNIKQLSRSLLGKGSNKFILGDAVWKGLKNRDEKLLADYSFYIDNYGKAVSNELYINLNLEKTFYSEKVDTAGRKWPVSYEYALANEDAVSLDMPPGYALRWMPQNMHNDFDGRFGYDISYLQQDNRIIMRKKVYRSLLLLEKSDLDDWNRMIDELRKAYNQSLTLYKP